MQPQSYCTVEVMSGLMLIWYSLVFCVLFDFISSRCLTIQLFKNKLVRKTSSFFIFKSTLFCFVLFLLLIFSRKVTILEDPDQNIHLKNLSLHQATTEEEALNLLFLGDTNRMIAEVINFASWFSIL